MFISFGTGIPGLEKERPTASPTQGYQPCLNLALAPPRDTSPSFAVADPGLGSQPTQGYQPFLGCCQPWAGIPACPPLKAR